MNGANSAPSAAAAASLTGLTLVMEHPEMKKVQHELFNRGLAIQYMQYVGAGTEGVLRVVVFSTHTSEQIDRLLFELEKIV